MNNNKGYYRYVDDVLNGHIVACLAVKQACARFRRDCEDERYEFREDVADRAIAFMQTFRFYEGSVAGQQVKLEDFQQFIVANLVGLYIKGTKRRKYTQAFIMMSRKNGKSALISLICLYYLIFDKEGAPQVLIGANSAQQAGVLYKMAKVFAQQIDSSGKVILPYRSEIRNLANEGFIRCLSASSNRLDGYGPSCFAIDEFHEAPTDDLLNVLRSGQAQRQRPLGIVITTAGFDKSKPCFKLLQHCRSVLNQQVIDEAQFAIIYELDEGDDFTDERNWQKANPNLGVSVKIDFIRERVMEAVNRPSKRVDVLTKQFDKYVDSAITWISSDLVQSALTSITYDDMIQSDNLIFAGVDLSSVCDITALSYMMYNAQDGCYYFKNEYWLPADVLNQSQNTALYREWAEQGYLHLTEGNVIDYDSVQAHLLGQYSQGLQIAKISYDRYNATQWAINCTASGLNMQPYSQNMASMNIPAKTLEILFNKRQIKIDNNPITPWMFRNVMMVVDGQANIRPAKDKSANKIDGVVAMLMAMGGFLAEQNYVGTQTNQQYLS